MKNSKRIKLFEIPVDKSLRHPDPPSIVLPRHEFTMGIVAPKGSGKTTLICNLLHQYKEYFHQIHVVSPTVKNDDKWDWIKNQKLLLRNDPLIAFLKDEQEKELKKRMVDMPIVEPVENEHNESELLEKYAPTYESFDGLIPEENFVHEYSSDLLLDTLAQQDCVIKYLKDHGKTKYLADRILFIFDDMVGSSLFSNERRNPFKMLNANHRHKSASIIMVTQAYMEIPKTIRTNYSCLILFEIFSDKELEAIMIEYPMRLKKNAWIRVYNYCVQKPYGFLYYNMQREDAKQRIMDCFDKVVFIE